jgi:lipoprotein NlpD
VEERTSTGGRSAPGATEPVAGAAKALPGAENAGKSGYYTVKPGDTLIRIGLDAGQNWRDIGRWNNLENPNQIEVGQVLRVVPSHLAGVPAAGETGVVTRPVTSATVSPVSPAASSVRPAAPASVPVTASAASEEELAWVWPAAGGLVRGFDEVNNKGLDLGGKAGDPVLAAMDGRVVYSGAGLRGYGNLIILKHNNTYLSAYAHNQTLLVKEDQSVHKGQKIAEMGSSDADRVALHFEIRRQGKPVDPAKYLPAR